ncbi:hypothetical protein KVR01_005476 [Diaporthe batatas]|uniref:uncharacterized protein n=1 Tax=Diaporthe batatas TaxID=748121 RepID=UPI001D05A8C2|nr:uncharacterized protein KVR01_005476 [Diaporthe batatas]KAG8165201.1 hypothetical protein KVR01_005476 [Diaporthe batatas]
MHVHCSSQVSSDNSESCVVSVSTGPLLTMTQFEIATRSQILSLLAVGFEHRQIFDYTGVSPDTQKIWWKKALKRGFDPSARPLLILDCHVEDGKRTGRPCKRDEEKDKVIELFQANPDGEKLSYKAIAERLDNRISAGTVHRILKEAGLKP